ncbi:3-keto steroid reductase [Entomortierella parvispora]|uniref:3beta-hydroxysteroid 3-dehydrogenase n=1 Tax=Entomortierella parvispora TaxID=205924 RepID=A0A9P3HGJ2_9FUNG|nr:3-keto steroid reductase [Entomortierella parvispora]
MTGSAPAKRVAIVTGANTGVGYAIVQRLVQESPDPLIVILACRNKNRAQEALDSLQEYFTKLQSHDPTRSFHPPDLRLELVDVGSVASVLAFNHRILQQFTRVDFLFCNAGVLPSVGLRWGKIITEMFMSPMDLFRRSDVLLQPKQHKTEDGIANVIACNVFGHYLMARGLESVLEGPSASQPGKVIWTSSLTAEKDSFDPNDWQGFESIQPYENSKWVTDLIAIRLNEVWSGVEGETEDRALTSGSSTSVLDSTPPGSMRRVTRSSSKMALESSSTTTMANAKKNIVSITTQPGVVCSGIGGLAVWIILLRMSFHYLVRIFGERNQTISSYHGAYSNTYVALANVSTVASTTEPSVATARAELDYRFKYGSAVGSFGKEFLKVEHVHEYERAQGKAVLDEMEILRQQFLKGDAAKC